MSEPLKERSGRRGRSRIRTRFELLDGAAMALPFDGREHREGASLKLGNRRFADKAAVHEDFFDGADDRSDGDNGGHQLLLVVGGLGDALADDQPTVDFDRRLGVVRLLKSTGAAGRMIRLGGNSIGVSRSTVTKRAGMSARRILPANVHLPEKKILSLESPTGC